MNENIDLTKILKDCPKGETFWSPVFGDIKFHDINQKRNFINIVLENGETWNINADGTISFGDVTSPEIMLYPSHEQRDWSKFTAPWLKKERFDPKTLKPFDRVLVSYGESNWKCKLFSHIDNNESKYKYDCCDALYEYCIPYNEDTKHLVGTTEEAPEYYRYWED